jgi:hypothetical protein
MFKGLFNMNILNYIKNWAEDVYWATKWKIIDLTQKNVEPFVGEEFTKSIKPKKKKKSSKKVKK